MKGGKRYWFKFYNNFFDNEKIKQIKRKKDGDRLIVIFINCLAIAANCESGGYLKISENKFFTIETLEHHMGRNQKSIENALDIFQEYSMIIQDEYGYKIKNWNKYQNLQEKGLHTKKDFTKDVKNVDIEREKAKEKLQEELTKQYENYRKEEYNKKIKQYYGTDFITKQFKQKTLENFITDEQNIKTKLAAQKFLTNFNDMKKGIIFVGKNGTGKTHISMAICNELLKNNVPIIFGTLTQLVEKYAIFYKDHTESELTKLYTKVDLLVIDDLGVEPMNDWLLSKLFTIINERLINALPFIITTNYDMEALKQRLSIPNKVCKTTDSIISRLSNMCYRVECRGKRL